MDINTIVTINEIGAALGVIMILGAGMFALLWFGVKLVFWAIMEGTNKVINLIKAKKETRENHKRQ